MTFTQSIKTCFRKYFTFSGRASRSEYWWFFLFTILGGLFFGFIEGVINGASGTPGGPTLLSGAFNLATFIPTLAVGWRRMHDSGRSGVYLFYPLIAIVGLSIFIGLFGGTELLTSSDPASLFEGAFGIIVIISLIIVALSPFIVVFWLTRPSQPGPNTYGPNPHEVSQ
ncbi:DUF805 domain-containing protein [Roseobacter litoralis]|uniref:DUF805 domain-containing protein n=1 Tax=Roseobacter litoralis (strain ATCC 49566 / DSM 6996 / JCM 21268 / NBRC 15278 / OCh 149) TaxID=391595 RepID=F7ZIZ4_ROSLO|nr:DUF805 domain-containing protein [Roseobacter litoralis]AEI95054.1 hypothetical protein DUF805 [Roseobacter litoralis Och 149]